MDRTTSGPAEAGRRALVTGATGFIGRQLVAELRAAGSAVCCLVRRPEQAAALAAEGVEAVLGDLRRPESLRGLDGFDTVFHLAGVLAARRAEEFERVNVTGCRNLYAALAAAARPPARIVHVSSIAAGGPARGPGPRSEDEPPAPVSLYGRTKLAGERAAAEIADRISVVVLRPAVVYGPGDRNLLPLFKMAARGLVLRPPGQPKLYSLVHVRDLARGMRLAARPERLAAGTYHVATGPPCRWDELVAGVGDAVGRRPRQVSLGRLPFVAAAWFNALAGRLSAGGRVNLLIPQKLPELFSGRWDVDCRRWSAALDLVPVALADGLRETARWYRDHGWLATEAAP